MIIPDLEGNSFSTYEKFQINVFKHSKDDLFEILVNNKALFEDIKNIPDKELFKQKDKLNITKEQLVDNLLLKLSMEDINNQLNNFEPYDVHPIVKEHFAQTYPRNCQLEVVSKIYNAIEKGYKYIFLEAVSGFGKSSIAMSLAEIYAEENSYFLVTTHQLASQYLDEFWFEDIEKLNARSSFYCKNNSKDRCNVASCKAPNCIYFKNSDFSKNFGEEVSCEFLFNLKECMDAYMVVTTYSFFILENFYQSNHLEKRKLLICDEAHNVDSYIADATSFILYKKDFDLIDLDIDEVIEELEVNEDYYFFLSKVKILLESSLDEYVGSDYRRCNRNLNKLNKFLSFFVYDRDNIFFERKNRKFSFQPIHVNNIIDDALLKYGEVCIFMSSSIFDCKNFALDLGIDEEEIYVLKVPNIFDLSKNPIKIYNDFNMNYENLKINAEKSLEIIKEILNEHPDEKGVIHTFSNECAEFLFEKLNDSRIISHDYNNREEVLDEFKESKEPLVLISPSMDEGVDLPGDYCRFQIIFKLPYKPYKGTRIGKRKAIYEDGGDWYRYTMLSRLIQMYGRGIRSEKDYCQTYILDNRIWDVIDEDLEERRIIPKYFLDAIIDSDE